ncbi:hypothetical protein JHK84_040718 [Glycine max]|uniref:Serine/threonine protein phosphatase 2A 55 kDa regulatory subunit B beta isoform n=1 Tax=Glycine soja TaxID=3848 RepID=A0A445H764_GLYSO|nr:hypothetical protein JHK86_040503 [Glycine max]KAG4966119.1 hypothetical protein JHK85_041094 [Glycine max]KAG5122378.1 hypothetical protein JHK84_040718 [Glycine max]RZB69449.1 Serine/threonine protein phosphatase 2A 55 kDa regulatory subunit B beta isoform [Glycine soja]
MVDGATKRAILFIYGAQMHTFNPLQTPQRRQVPTPSRPSRSLGNSITRVVRHGAESAGVNANGNSFDITTKLLHLTWHPAENSIAYAGANSLK